MIKNGTVVSLSYLLKNEEGEELDSADVQDPFSYLHGAGQIVPGLENELEGLKQGDKKHIVVKPEDGYGEMIPELQLTVEKNRFPVGQPVQEGMQFTAEVGEGQEVRFTVVSVEGNDVHIDGNHPLAGQTLHFDIEVLEVRAATKEEMSHGHSHAPGSGHDH